MWTDTQRREGIELMGQVFGTSGTAPYIHLQLEMSRRHFGNSMPTLVANDGDDAEASKVEKLAREYGADYVCWPALGHTPGDLRIFRESMDWGTAQGLDIVVKFSRRVIPLVSWRHALQCLVALNPEAGFFTRRHLDEPAGLFRTDGIAYRLRVVKTPHVIETLEETIAACRGAGPAGTGKCVEHIFDSFSRTCGGWVHWDLLGPNFYKPWNKAMQWRGLLPFHYADLARQLDLPYTDTDFANVGWLGRYQANP